MIILSKICHTLLLNVFVLALLAGAAHAEEAEVPPGAPVAPDIEFEETAFDFGKTYRGDKVEHVYHFGNLGQKDLKILEVKPSCGCTAVLLSNSTIPPGGKGNVKVTFDSTGLGGRGSKSILVRSNDPDEPAIILKIEGLVQPLLRAKPAVIDFGEVKKGKKRSRKVKISKEVKETRITSILLSSTYLIVEFPSTISPDQESVEGKIKLSPEAPPGEINEKLLVRTDGKIKPQLEIPIRGEIVGDIRIKPSRLYFGVISRGEVIERNLSVYDETGKGLEILRVDSTLPNLTTEVRKGEDKNLYEITLTLDPREVAGSFRGLIRIFTNNPDEPVLVVSAYGVVRKS